jgi:hypothetical protein
MSARDPYYDLDYVSNSRLNVVWNMIHGHAIKPANPENFKFGGLFHERSLEPENYDAGNEYHERVTAMHKAAGNNIVFKSVLENPNTRKEYAFYFMHERTKQMCKMKVDATLLSSVYDLKTTACTSIEEFKISMIEYGYHRQAAFYLDPLDAKRFVFIPINKKHPYKTFTFPLMYNDPIVQQGREEIEMLMDEHLRMVREGVNFQKLMYSEV